MCVLGNCMQCLLFVAVVISWVDLSKFTCLNVLSSCVRDKTMLQSNLILGRASRVGTCKMTNLRRHFCAILRKVSHAISWTPGCSSCMNSKSLFTT